MLLKLTNNVKGIAWTSILTDEQQVYVSSFQNRTRVGVLKDVMSGNFAVTEKFDAAFSAACFTHCSTEASRFQTLTVNGISLQQAFDAWFVPFWFRHLLESGEWYLARVLARRFAPFLESDVTAQSRIVMDNCSGFECGLGCKNQ